MRYEAPIRCTRCGAIIFKKPKAKTPKFCTTCREIERKEWLEKKVGTNRKIRIN